MLTKIANQSVLNVRCTRLSPRFGTGCRILSIPRSYCTGSNNTQTPQKANQSIFARLNDLMTGPNMLKFTLLHVCNGAVFFTMFYGLSLIFHMELSLLFAYHNIPTAVGTFGLAYMMLRVTSPPRLVLSMYLFPIVNSLNRQNSKLVKATAEFFDRTPMLKAAREKFGRAIHPPLAERIKRLERLSHERGSQKNPLLLKYIAKLKAIEADRIKLEEAEKKQEEEQEKKLEEERKKQEQAQKKSEEEMKERKDADEKGKE